MNLSLGSGSGYHTPGYSRLFRFDVSGFDDTRGAFTLALHEARELGLRHAHWIGPVLRKPFAQVWRG